MGVLLLLTVVCFLALFGSALLIARHVRIVGLRSIEDDLPRLVDLKLEEGRMDRPDRLGLRKVTLAKEPDWRFLVSGERRRVQRGIAKALPARKEMTSAGVERRGLRGWTYFDEETEERQSSNRSSASKAMWNGSDGRHT